MDMIIDKDIYKLRKTDIQWPTIDASSTKTTNFFELKLKEHSKGTFSQQIQKQIPSIFGMSEYYHS